MWDKDGRYRDLFEEGLLDNPNSSRVVGHKYKGTSIERQLTMSEFDYGKRSLSTLPKKRKADIHEPMIGITAVHNSFGLSSYVSALRLAGALPVIITSSDSLDLVSGVLIPGGCDINPSFYGQSNKYAVGLNYKRDELEFEIAQEALALDIPILGICRGHQMLAVAAGGTLYQDIGRQFKGKYSGTMNHRSACRNHRVKIAVGSILDNLTKMRGPHLQLNSLHHQSIRRLPDGFRVAARATDGIVEGIQSKANRFAVGVQYHPEMLIDGRGKFGKLHAYNLLTEFVQECM